MKALEAISIQYDQSVSDAYGNIVEFRYGGDNCDAAHLDKMSMAFLFLTHQQLADQFGDQKQELEQIVALILRCLEVKMSLLSSQLTTECHVPVNILSLIDQLPPLKLSDEPVTHAKVKSEVKIILARFENETDRQTLFLRTTLAYHLRSSVIVDEMHMSVDNFTNIIKRIEDHYQDAQVNAGEMVGVLAAESVGEPCTQLTLNSFDYEERIVVRDTKTGDVLTPKIGEFVNQLFDQSNKNDVTFYTENGTEYLDTTMLSFEVPDISESATLQFHALQGVTRHPPPGDAMLVKVTTMTGREIVATPTKSFLLRRENKLVPVNGSDLRVGQDFLPVAMTMPTIKEPLLHIDMGVYADNPFIMPLDEDFGFFIGLYLSVGHTTDHVIISNNSYAYRQRILKWCDLYDLACLVSTDIQIYSEMLCRFLLKTCGSCSHLKDVPDFSLGSNKIFLGGLIDGYFSGDGCVTKNSVSASSASRDLLVGIASVLSRFGIFSRLYTPDNPKQVYQIIVKCGNAVRFAKSFTLTIPDKQDYLDYFVSSAYSPGFDYQAEDIIPSCKFMDGSVRDMKRLDLHSVQEDWVAGVLRNEVFYDRIVSIEKVAPTTPLVFDLTVEDTRNFLTRENIACRDTFHHAGVAEKNITLGVPRIKELIDARRVNQTPSTDVYLLEPFCLNKQYVDKFKETLVETHLCDVVESFEILLDEDPHSTIIDNDVDRFLTNAWKIFGTSIESPSRYVLRIVLNRGLLVSRELNVTDVKHLIENTLPGDSMYHIQASEPNMREWIIRIRMCKLKEMRDNFLTQIRKKKNDKRYTEEQIGQILLEFEKNMAHAFLKYLSRTVYICGIEGIEGATTQEMNTTKWDPKTLEKKTVSEYYVQANGVNLREFWNINVVDWRRSWCNSIFEILDLLGIEAVAMVLFHEIKQVLSFDGCYVNTRHIQMIVNVMTRSGGIMPMNRHGLNKLDVGPLVKCTFEETVDILFDGGLFSENNPVVSISDSIMTGQPIPGGTGKMELRMTADYEDKMLCSAKAKETKIRVIRTYYSEFANNKSLEKTARVSLKRKLIDEEDKLKNHHTQDIEHRSDLFDLDPAFDFKPLSPSYHPSSPTYCPTSPTYCPTSPTYCPISPTYCPTSPTYCPTSPTHCPTSPTHCPISPTYCPASPTYCPTSPTYLPTSPTHRSPRSCDTTSPATPPRVTEPGSPQYVTDPRSPRSVNFSMSIMEIDENNPIVVEVQEKNLLGYSNGVSARGNPTMSVTSLRHILSDNKQQTTEVVGDPVYSYRPSSPTMLARCESTYNPSSPRLDGRIVQDNPNDRKTIRETLQTMVPTMLAAGSRQAQKEEVQGLYEPDTGDLKPKVFETVVDRWLKYQ
jgi:DNA-directed RNA polymerase beta' subunit